MNLPPLELFGIDIVAWFRAIGASNILDIVFLALLIYAVLAWFKRTHAAFILTGILIIAGVYLVARQLHMEMTARVFEQFFAVILIALVVIFQEDLRRFFEQVAVWSLNRRLPGRRRKAHLSREEVEVLVRTMMDLAGERVGALLVVKGRNMIDRHLDGGVDLHGELSEALIKSLFDPHSIGHDGAAIIEGNRLMRFACHLPLSKNLKKVGKHGTRHAAALGLTELSDALSIVVSEEKGTISVAKNSEMDEVSDPEKLARMIERHYEEVSPPRGTRTWEDFFKKNWREKAIALVLAVGLWFVNVHGSEITYKTFFIPVEFAVPPKSFVVKEVVPKEVRLTFHAARSVFYFMTQDRIKLFLKVKVQEGTQRFKILAGDIVFPQDLFLDSIRPDEVSIRVEKVIPVEAEEGAPQGPGGAQGTNGTKGPATNIQIAPKGNP